MRRPILFVLLLLACAFPVRARAAASPAALAAAAARVPLTVQAGAAGEYYEVGRPNWETPWLPDLRAPSPAPESGAGGARPAAAAAPAAFPAEPPAGSVVLPRERLVQIVLLGDGYLEGEKEEFERRLREWYARLLSLQPFGELRGAFRVTAVWTPSAERASAAQRSRFGIAVAVPEGGRIEMVRGGVPEAGRQAIAEALVRVGADLTVREGRLLRTTVVLLVKGSGRVVSGRSVTARLALSAGEASVRVAVAETSHHELGHAFGGLRDEYISTADSTASTPPASRARPGRPGNLGYTRRFADVPWAHLAPGGALNPNAASPIGRAWTGGLQERGVWHCEPFCLMNGSHENWDLAKTKRGVSLRQWRFCFWCEELLVAHTLFVTEAIGGLDEARAWKEWVETWRPLYQQRFRVAERIRQANEEYRVRGVAGSPLCEEFVERP